jgi:hypothetical protein
LSIALFRRCNARRNGTPTVESLILKAQLSRHHVLIQYYLQSVVYYLLGIRPIDFLGNFYMTNATEMIFGTIDSDKSVSVELKHDDKLPVESSTYIQVKILLFLLLNFNIYFK